MSIAPPGPIGIIANPASGKDIRRVVARAAIFDNQSKRGIVERVIAGAMAAGANRFLYMDDPNGIAFAAAERFGSEATVEPLPGSRAASARDTTEAAATLRAAGASVVVSLGGDGTNRALALGWPDCPLIPLSTGTNNVFPVMLDASIAGAAAGLLATGVVSAEEVSRIAKVVTVSLPGGGTDIALIDAALLDGRFVGSRAVWEARALHAAVLTRAEPHCIGVSSIGGLIDPVSAADDGGLALEFGPGGRSVLAPIAPGSFQWVRVAGHRRLRLGEEMQLAGPGVLALDGEREHVVRESRTLTLRISREGPRVIDVAATMRLAVCRGAFQVHEPEVPS